MQYNDIALNPITRQFLDAYKAQPSHALLLEGQLGVGLGTIAASLANDLVEHETDIETIAPDEKGSISIETVRSLYVDTRGIHATNHVILIDDADAMSPDAQHAFLKLLEEPTAHTLFILTTHTSERLLATIHSRLQRIVVQPISQTASIDIVTNAGISDAARHHQLLFIANGRPAELTRLVRDETQFGNVSSLIRDARQLLAMSAHEKLVIATRYSDREQANQLVAMLARLLAFSLEKQFSPKLAQAVIATEECQERLLRNGHVKTQLLNLVLRLS